MNQVAVITGDIIQSGKIKDQHRKKMLEVLKDTFNAINQTWFQNSKVEFEIFRGDSFQGIINNPVHAVKTAVCLRSSLRRYTNNSTLSGIWDARIAIGIGGVDARMSKITESDGEAFQHSGILLDSMKKNDERLQIRTPEESLNAEFTVTCALCDVIMKRWTTLQSEAIYPHLLEQKNQKEIAQQLNISQRAVGKRLAAGNIDAVERFIARFESIIN